MLIALNITFIEGLYYTLKAFDSLLSGFECLEVRTNGDWEPWNPGDIPVEDPYYVCAKFKNGRHLPLPLVLNPEQSEHLLQKELLKEKGDLLMEAREMCAAYEAAFLEREKKKNESTTAEAVKEEEEAETS